MTDPLHTWIYILYDSAYDLHKLMFANSRMDGGESHEVSYINKKILDIGDC